MYGISFETREKPTANRRESALRARESDLLILTLAIQLRCLARPFIGTVRANPVAAPAAPNGNLPLEFRYRLSVNGHFPYIGLINTSLPHGRRWGADRICPNGPDKGTSKTAKLDCESEDQQIRFFEQANGLRDSRRFAVCFFSCFHTQ